MEQRKISALENNRNREIAGKIIYPNLLPAGIHKISLNSLEDKLLKPFDEKRTRAYLCNRLRELISELRKFKISMIIWIDGSFCSLKPNPSDIDIVIFFDTSQINLLDGTSFDNLLSFLNNRDILRARYGCDLFFEDMKDENRYHYWRSLFGFNQLNEPKGFIQIRVEANEYQVS